MSIKKGIMVASKNSTKEVHVCHRRTPIALSNRCNMLFQWSTLIHGAQCQKACLGYLKGGGGFFYSKAVIKVKDVGKPKHGGGGGGWKENWMKSQICGVNSKEASVDARHLWRRKENGKSLCVHGGWRGGGGVHCIEAHYVMAVKTV